MSSFEDVRSSLLTVYGGQSADTLKGLGNGFFATAEGHVLTCWHVISDPENRDRPGWEFYEVCDAHGHIFAAEVVARLSNPANDIAVLKTGASLAAPVRFEEMPASSSDLLIWFLDISPNLQQANTTAPGRSELLQDVVEAKLLVETELRKPQLPVLSLKTQAISRGMSGAPLISRETGRVVGILSHRSEDGRALAIPIRLAIEHFPLLRRRLGWVSDFLVSAKQDYDESRKEQPFFGSFLDLELNPDYVFLTPDDQELLQNRRRFERYSILKAVAEFSPLFVLGEPGAGKTTALREVSRKYLEGFGDGHGQDCLPLYVPIVNVETSGPDDDSIIIALVQAAFKRLNYNWAEMTRKEILSLVQKHTFIFLFDGLNEIAMELIRPYCRSFIRFIFEARKVNSTTRFVITSRLDNILKWRGEISSITPYRFEIQKLKSDEQIRGFVRLYINSASERLRFLNHLNQHYSAGQMAQNPLLLTMMIAVYRKDGQLPLSRAELLDRVVMGLLAGWSVGSGPRRFTVATKRAFLCELAYQLRFRKLGLGAPEAVIMQILRSIRLETALTGLLEDNQLESLVEEAVHDRILRKDSGSVRFWPEVFQEYLVGWKISNELQTTFDPGEGEEVDRKRRAKIQIRMYEANTDWHQPLAIGAGLASSDAAEKVVEQLTTEQPVLAAHCIANCSQLDPDAVGRFTGAIGARARALIQIPSIGFWVNIVLAVVTAIVVLNMELETLRPITLALFAAVATRLHLGQFMFFLLSGVIVVVVAELCMKRWSRLLDWCEGKVINDILPNRFLHPQLRALILIGTEVAERTLAALRLEAQNAKYVGQQIKSLIERAGLILRFRKEEIPVLLAMLESEPDREYALDRLGQLREPQAIDPLLVIIRKQNDKFARTAVSSLCLIASGLERPDYTRVVTELRRVLDDVRQSHLKRLSIYDGLLSLGETGIRQPGLWDAYLFQLQRTPAIWTLGAIAIAGLLLLFYRLFR